MSVRILFPNVLPLDSVICWFVWNSC